MTPLATPGDSLARFGGAVASSAVMRDLFEHLASIAHDASPLLLLGEPGVGKQLLARGLWSASRSASGPFVVVDGSSSDVQSLAWELGAETRDAYVRALAGVLFVRSVEDLPPIAQTGLYLELVKAAHDAAGPRIVCSARRDLLREADAERFSAPLAELLTRHALFVPPLRARPEDVLCLASHFAEAHGLPEGTLPAQGLEALTLHTWPGNVRELAQAVELIARLLARAHAGAGMAGGGAAFGFDPTRSFADHRKEQESAFELAYVRWLLFRHGGNASAAAREARMDRKHLRELARRHLPESELAARGAAMSERPDALGDRSATPMPDASNDED